MILTKNDAPPNPSVQYSDEQVLKYKRYLRRSQTVKATCELETEIIQIAKILLEEYRRLQRNLIPIPADLSILFEKIRMELPDDAFFTNEYFIIPLAPIAFLKDIAYLYCLPNDLTRRTPSFQLDHVDTNNKTLQLHLWIGCVLGRTDYMIHEIISANNTRRNTINTTSSPSEPN